MSADHAAIRRTFKRFGTILDVLIFTKPVTREASGPPEMNFGFVSFASGASVEALMGAANSKAVNLAQEDPDWPQVELLVERRRDHRPNAIDKLRERLA